MSRQNFATKTSKRYRYTSFKAQIDALRIEPARNLNKRVHDYVESSHFLASLEHWKEINLSAGFTSFTDDIESVVQTLPQILYHENQIFQTLITYIDKHDERSLQPLLDLMAQFCHDLGPDFIKFNKTAIESLVSLLDDAVRFESSNVFEWGFNCLAYLFKYLSRILTDDLMATFDLLFPLLAHPKDYISRFSAEAMSFLLRKCNSKKLAEFATNALQHLEQDTAESNYYDGLLTLFTESLISTRGAMHSKSTIIIPILFTCALKSGARSTCLACDVWMNIAKHASFENLEPVYTVAIQSLHEEQTPNLLENKTRLLCTLVYAESGSKVPDWLQIWQAIEKILLSQQQDLKRDPKTLAFLFAAILRNADTKTLTVHHRALFDYYLEAFSLSFLFFFKMCLSIAPERVVSFSIAKYLQKFINSNWEQQAEKIALFLFDFRDDSRLSVTIPSEFVSSIVESLTVIKSIENDAKLYEFYWKILILKYAGCSGLNVFWPHIQLLLEQEHPRDLLNDTVGLLLPVVSGALEEDESVISKVLGNIDRLKNSLPFLQGLQMCLNSETSRNAYLANIKNNSTTLLAALTDNLNLPDSHIRYETIKLIILILGLCDSPIPEVINECKILEEIPVTLDNSRNIAARIRKIGEVFLREKADHLQTLFVLKYLFGLLTIRFSPIWEAVYEILPSLYQKDEALVWSNVLALLRSPEVKVVLDYYEPCLFQDEEAYNWNSNVDRLDSAIQSYFEMWKKFANPSLSIIELSRVQRGRLEYPGQIRSQALKVMLLVPNLAERHSKDVVSLLFNQQEFESIFGDNNDADRATAWSDNDRNALLRLVAKFKNIKSIYRSDKVHERLMVLLGSKSTEVQKLALDAIFAFKDARLIKYKDVLQNLLDDTLFKDEMTKFFASGSAKTVEESDERELLPYVLRIFFGRAQSANVNATKKGRKTAVISALPSLKSEYVGEFLKFGCSRFNYQYFFENNDYEIDRNEISLSTFRRMTGFINIISAAIGVLGTKFVDAVEVIIRPLLYTIHLSDYAIRNAEPDHKMEKMCISLRQQSTKCLNDIFEWVGSGLSWEQYMHEIFLLVVEPRLPNFETENLQQPSSLMKLMLYWLTHKELSPLVYMKDFACAHALLNVLCNKNAKQAVIKVILEASKVVVDNPLPEAEYVEVLTLISATCLHILPELYTRLTERDSIANAIDLLLKLTESGYVQDTSTRKHLLKSLTGLMGKSSRYMDSADLTKVLKAIAVLLQEYDGAWEELEPTYITVSSFYRIFQARSIRAAVNEVFNSIATKFVHFRTVAYLLSDLNSYSGARLEEYDFPRRLTAFKKFIEVDAQNYSELQWLPVVCSSVSFISDDDLAIRTNGSHILMKFIDFINSKESDLVAVKAVAMLKQDLLPYLRVGLRNKNEEVRSEYINILAYIVEKSRYYKELDDMKVLLHDGDEEANFFMNISHIQLHRRQRAIRKLRDYASNLGDTSVSHYLLPILEHYVFTEEEKYRNLGNEALLSIGTLSNCISWNQYKALLRRYLAMLNSNKQFLKETVQILAYVSVSLKNSANSQAIMTESRTVLKNFPADMQEPKQFILSEIYPKLSKILATRDEETIVARIPLTEALVNLLMALPEDETVIYLPGVLTSVCQVLRSRSDDLREAVRKTLAKVSVLIGPRYLKFIIKELLSALRRGSQVHILSYTVHHILRAVGEQLQHKDLDDSADLIIQIVMEDIFGTAGQEKDSDNYHSKIKEVKVNRSYDTSEILAANISLETFGVLLKPIKLLLMERMNLKSQNKLEEVLRRLALGLNHNPEASSVDVLKLCYGIFEEAKNKLQELEAQKFNHKPKSEQEEYFLVNLNAKSDKVKTEFSLYTRTFQKFALDLVRAVLARQKHLLEAQYLDGFMPLLREALGSDNEAVLISALRVLVIFVKLDFPEESEPIFKNCARQVLGVIKNSPSTSNELCQVGLKFLSGFIRHKDDRLKDTALSYVLTRILPDLNEPTRQSLAFNFLKALLSKHVMLPELYDVMASVREIMVTNHSKEIRDISRSVYYQFLMEYDQSRGRLEKQFKFLVDNLQYPSHEGRQSVMELLNLIITKSSPALLEKLSSSFFVALANVSINDDLPKCREMASILLARLVGKMQPVSLEVIERYLSAWLKQAGNSSFLNLGLRVYKIYTENTDPKRNVALKEQVLERITSIVASTSLGSDTEWDLIYTALNTFQALAEKPNLVDKNDIEKVWKDVVSCLLYPHIWVRIAASRLVEHLLSNDSELGLQFVDSDIQNIASRLLHQLGAPSIPASLSTISVRVLVRIAMRWKTSNAGYIASGKSMAGTEQSYHSAIDYMVSKACNTIRSEEHPAESYMGKKACMQLLVLIIQLLDEPQVTMEAEKILLAIYTYIEGSRSQKEDEEDDLVVTAHECMQNLEQKMTVSSFTNAYAAVKQAVIRRRQERKSRKAVLAVTAPEAAAQRKIKRHARSREKRKYEKDENGYYQRRNKKKRL